MVITCMHILMQDEYDESREELEQFLAQFDVKIEQAKLAAARHAREIQSKKHEISSLNEHYNRVGGGRCNVRDHTKALHGRLPVKYFLQQAQWYTANRPSSGMCQHCLCARAYCFSILSCCTLGSTYYS
jgi:hypothetical protein